MLDLSFLESKRMDAQCAGVLVATGPDCYIHYVQDTPQGTVISKYTQPFAKVGDRVMFAKFGGIDVLGKDGFQYRVLRDEDITAVIDKDIKFSDIEIRDPKALRQKAGKK